MVKASAYNVGGQGSIPGSGRSPGEGNGTPTPILLPGKSHGWRSLVGYSPWGRKVSDTTERFTSLHFTSDSGEKVRHDPAHPELTSQLNKEITPVVTNKGIKKAEILGTVECRAEGT